MADIRSPKEIREYESKKWKFWTAIQKKYAAMETSKNRRCLQEEIDYQCELWNQKNPKERNYFDLHWMSLRGAMDYVQRIELATRKEHDVTIRLETGRGLHSKKKIPVIKQKLLKTYSNHPYCTIQQDISNPGVLKLIVHPYQ